jgi:hypothetical protein
LDKSVRDELLRTTNDKHVGISANAQKINPFRGLTKHDKATLVMCLPSDEVKKSSSQESGRLEEIRQKRPRRPVRWPSTLPHPPLALAASRWTKRWKSVFGILPALLFSKTQLHGKLQIRHLALVARSSSGPVFSGGAALRT